MFTHEIDTPENRARGERRFNELDCGHQERTIRILSGFGFNERMCELGTWDDERWLQWIDTLGQRSRSLIRTRRTSY